MVSAPALAVLSREFLVLKTALLFGGARENEKDHHGKDDGAGEECEKDAHAKYPPAVSMKMEMHETASVSQKLCLPDFG
jgi:hypothetical protein